MVTPQELLTPEANFLDKEIPLDSNPGIRAIFRSHELHKIAEKGCKEEREEHSKHKNKPALRRNLLVVFPRRFKHVEVLEHLSLFQAHLFALLAQELVQGFLDADFRFTPQVLRIELRRLLELDHTDIAMLALERSTKSRIHALDALLEFLVALAVLAAVELLDRKSVV